MGTITPNIAGSTMLRVVVSVLAVVCKLMYQLPTMLGPAVHLGQDTAHKTLVTNIVVPHFSNHGTKEILGVVATTRKT